ncbi:amide hydrolase [Rhodobacteraceae bacterium PD-2]|nr:amide hydrolase [Rhodobacteraceae bacterium PD-2]
MTMTHPTCVVPGPHWTDCSDPAAHGVTPTVRKAATAALDALQTTSFTAVVGGEQVFEYGDTSEVSYLASTRKSILSMLYGKYVEAGVIDLNATIADLGIDEARGLLPIEKTATLRDLLITSSGVYYPAGSPGGDMTGVPERGSKTPGRFFHYNNWDFNVLGAVFEELTGTSVHDAFARELAEPLGLQDFDRARQRMLGYGDKSRYLAYHFFLSGRDMARLGLLMVRNGRWGDQQLISPEWVRESTSMHVAVRDMARPKPRVAGYSYLWWLPRVPEGKLHWQGAFVAAGHFGQFILGVPALDMGFVNRRAVTDEQAIGRNQGTFTEELPTVTMEEFLGVCDLFIDAHTA